MRSLLALCAVGFGTTVLAQQPYPLESVMRFQVWNGSEWANEISVLPGSRVEWRVTVSYTGTNTNVFALADLRYQPTISNWDNDGASVDQLSPWRNGGNGGQPPGGEFGMLDKQEGIGNEPLIDYGRSGCGTIGTIPSNGNTLTAFTHVNGAGGAPPGSWLRIAGASATSWPIADGDPWTTSDGLRVIRGVPATQHQYLVSGLPHPYFVAGTQDIVLLRQAVTLSSDAGARSLEISTGEWSMLRAGAAGSSDNRRYMTWFDSAVSFSSSYRSAVEFTSAAIHVIPPIPAPGAIAVCAGGALILARKRRR
jgi:hypothetical protein